jgi:nucleoside-diphosphate-sugar epimerase
MKVLILGGCGFIGRHFVKRLLDDGHTVTAIDNMYSGVERHDWMFQPNSIDNLQLLITDCRAFFASAVPDSLWSASRFDLVIHCAAIVGGRIKIEDDPLEVATDLSIDSEFFRWVTRLPAGERKPKVIYFSSSAVYPLELQTKETHCLLYESLVNFHTHRISKPDMSYGWSKMTGEFLAKLAVERYGLDVVIYRPFGGYGEDQAMTYPFPSIVRRVVDGHNPVFIWGSGDQERDFVHVDDVVECVLKTKDVLKPGEVLNIGRGEPVSFFKLAETVAKVAGVDVSIRNDPNRPEGVFSRVADVYRMQQHYAPKIDLETGIAHALKTALDTRRGKM